MKTMHRIGLSALAIAVALTVAGCDKKPAGQDKVASAVTAKVNKDEITVSQLNFELSKLSNLSPEQTKQATNQMLKTMVDQQLLVQKALTDKLDLDPQVIQAIEASRRQILAQALIKKMTDGLAKPTDAEMADYYAKNPALFSERRIYRLEEINVQVTPENIEAVKTQLKQVKNLGDFVSWLKEQNIPARVGQSTKTAEQLPLEILPRLHAMKDGQAMTIAAPGALNILVVANSQTQPLSEEQAKPLIERFLETAKKRELATAELKKLKEAAKIEYQGDYADAGKEAEVPQESPASDQPVQPAVDPAAQPAAKQATQPAEAAKDASAPK